MGAGFEEVEFLDASGWIELLDAVDYGGLNGAPAGRFLDVSGGVGVSGRNRTRLRIRGIVGSVPTISTTLEGLLDVFGWSCGSAGRWSTKQRAGDLRA